LIAAGFCHNQLEGHVHQPITVDVKILGLPNSTVCSALIIAWLSVSVALAFAIRSVPDMALVAAAKSKTL